MRVPACDTAAFKLENTLKETRQSWCRKGVYVRSLYVIGDLPSPRAIPLGSGVADVCALNRVTIQIRVYNDRPKVWVLIILRKMR